MEKTPSNSIKEKNEEVRIIRALLSRKIEFFYFYFYICILFS